MFAQSDRFSYIYSCDIDLNLRLKVGTLEGKQEKTNFQAILDNPELKFSGFWKSSCPNLFVLCQVVNVNSDGQEELISLPMQTSFKPFSTGWSWNEWISMPIKYKDIPFRAQIVFSVYDVYSAGKSLKVGTAKIPLFDEDGVLRCGVYHLVVHPENGSLFGLQTSGEVDRTVAEKLERFLKLEKKYLKGRLVEMDWLDRRTTCKIEEEKEKSKQNAKNFFLVVEFPEFRSDQIDYTVVFYEQNGDVLQDTIQEKREIIPVPDPDIFRENVVENKHHKLTRSLRHGPVAKELKPNSMVRDLLNALMKYPSTQTLSSDEQDYVWKFRYYLSLHQKALTKFLKCVQWETKQEAEEAIKMIDVWEPMDVEDALELFSSQFEQTCVRQYGVSRLAQASNEDLLLYLLQLVAALRYEELEDEPMSAKASTAHYGDGEERAVPTGSDPLGVALLEEPQESSYPSLREEETAKLGPFLVSRACSDRLIANYLYWYVQVECDNEDRKVAEKYLLLSKNLLLALKEGNQESHKYRIMIKRQRNLVDQLVGIARKLSTSRESRPKRIEMLKSLLDVEALKSFDPLPLPVDPEVKVTGIIAEEAHVFKSALMPIKISFRTDKNEKYDVIFKNGDDLRQDQLILQVLKLMDKLLRRENLDLKLTPYRALATSTSNGFIECVPNVHAVAEVLAKWGTIQDYFRKCAPSEVTSHGIAQEVMDTYVKSCAGYCVITYLLGIGDRHLDNLLLVSDGRLFHIDFGYILGRDPKPLPPPMKLCKEMVEAMGGQASQDFKRFREHCFNAFLILRRSANLFLNLFSLMVHTNVQDIAIEPDKAVKKVQDKFCLDLSEEQAIQFFQSLIDESVNAMFAVMVERIHKWAQYWRK
ncbi:phosphatidylinositol 3-kinase catalytic subunit type 3-like [Oscarella lobularis]|uniref:phosphatidylinositol 3-kinase catalytic subunit type 3-like n=1 Tax=Oscarella lobularis TaxID=121494 RepID=UPI00331378B3